MSITSELRKKIIHECTDMWVECNSHDTGLMYEIISGDGVVGFGKYSDQELIDELESYCDEDDDCRFCELRIKSELEIETHKMLKSD